MTMSDDAIDRGLAEAFGRGGAEPLAPSVLQALQARASSVLGVHLDSQGLDDAPVRVTEAVKAMRDLSGRYQMLGEIGRGGVGVVYKGRDSDLGRDVAMKVLKDEYAHRPEVLARFVEEAQIGGQLQHPGIVPVYELGLQPHAGAAPPRAGERPYFVMKLVKGETLAAQLARRADPEQGRRRLLGIFEQVCQTLAYAHARRVIHRDLKPANVMIGAFGEVQVVDWGFAKVLPKGGVADEAGSVARASGRSVIETVRSAPGSGSNSVAGSVLGTPAYMSPEQANGDVEHLDRRSDVFGLGAILCELLTGEPPYREADGDLVRQAATGALEGVYERLRGCAADPALVTLCTECLARARSARPESAAEVAERVAAYLTSVEERARRAELDAAQARYRQRTTWVAAAAVLLVFAFGAGVWTWVEGQAQTRRAEALQRVAAAMSDASGARGRAREVGQDASLWAAAVASAERLVTLASSSDVDVATRAGAQALRDAVQAESRAAEVEAKRLARDDTMLQRLETLRIPDDDDVRAKGWNVAEGARLDAAYAAAFGEYLAEVSLFLAPAEQVLASLQRGEIAVELATSLDHWGLVRDELRNSNAAPDPAGTVRIRQLAARLDTSGSWLAQLRALLPDAAHASEGLRELAERADLPALGPTACRSLSDALWRAGDEEEAIEVLRAGQELFPQDFDLCFRLALCLQLLAEPRWEGALETYRIAHALRPEHNEVLHRQGLALEQLGRHADAERLFRILLEREPGNAHWERHVAGSLIERGELREAEAAYRRALDDGPDHAEALNGLGTALARQGRTEEAIELFRRAQESGDPNASILENLGLALHELGRLDEAIEAYRSALSIDPENAETHSNLGLALYGLGQLEEAITSQQRAIELDPQAVRFPLNLGVALQAAGRADEAVGAFEAALGIDPENGEALCNLGIMLRMQGLLPEAIELQQRACGIDPEDPRFHHNLGYSLVQAGQFAEATECLERALDFQPDDAALLVCLGLAYVGSGAMEEALWSLGQAVQLAPDNPFILFECGQAFAQAGEEDEAVSTLERALLLTRRDPQLATRLESKIEGALAGVRGSSDLEDVITGRREAASNEEWTAAVLAGYRQRRFDEVVALSQRTLARSPGFQGEGLYSSACAAALLAAGPGAEPGDRERPRLRGLAREWLTRELECSQERRAAGDPGSAEVQVRLKRALSDPDFTSVRGDALAELSIAERDAWQELWSRLEQMTGGQMR